MPQFDSDRLLAAWHEAVFGLYLAGGKIEAQVVENMRTWPHSPGAPRRTLAGITP